MNDSTMAPDPLSQPQAFLRSLYDAAVRRAMPLHNMAAVLPPVPKGRTLVLGAGKAGASMVHALEALWPKDAPLSGLVVTRYGHLPERPAGVPAGWRSSRPPTRCPTRPGCRRPNASWRSHRT